MELKISTWNIENSRKLIEPNLSLINTERLNKVKDTIIGIDSDILCLIEGPPFEDGIEEFCKIVLNNQYKPVLIDDEEASKDERNRMYGNHMGGNQWVWYLVKPHLIDHCRIQVDITWNNFTNEESWSVNYWSKIESSKVSHYRQPQVMIFDDGDGELEFIGVHLKSKINRKRIEFDDDNNLIGNYLEEALKARVKLATQARNVRKYIDKRFEQTAFPSIILLGDCNDGPGHDYFEKQYLFFDLVQNLQGDIMKAERFFNHALFDAKPEMRWTAKFKDPFDRKYVTVDGREKEVPKKLLIDHIMFSQPLVRGNSNYQVHANAGMVEHVIFDRINSIGRKASASSDHVPISVILTKNIV
jgi:exonuclease III